MESLRLMAGLRDARLVPLLFDGMGGEGAGRWQTDVSHPEYAELLEVQASPPIDSNALLSHEIRWHPPGRNCGGPRTIRHVVLEGKSLEFRDDDRMLLD